MKRLRFRRPTPSLDLTPSMRRRRRHGTRLFGFGAAVVLLGQCGNGCAPTTTNPVPSAIAPVAATTPTTVAPGAPGAAPAAPAAAPGAAPAGTAAPAVTTRPTTPPAAPTTQAPGVAPSTTGGSFGLLPLGTPLPSDAQCAAAVRANPSPENRPRNVPYNNTPWYSIAGFYPRATGNFTGSTDDIIRWAACKWGYPEDLLRAQAARESTGKMDALGVWISDPARCLPGHPIGADGRPGQCPGAVGIVQIYGYHFPQGTEGATRSTAYNLDLGLAIWRDCFEGNERWLGSNYGAGDLWGCVGRFYSGDWYGESANWYIGELQSWMNQRIWTTARYINDQGPSV